MLSSKKVLCLVTGAARGVGYYFAHALAKEVGPESTLIFSSRRLDKLEELQQKIISKVGNKILNIRFVQWDLENPSAEQYEKDLKNVLEPEKEYDVALIIHNAADIGDLTKKVVDFNDVQMLQKQLNINLVSMLVLNSVWLRLVKNIKKKLVVNITDGSTIMIFPSIGMTSMVKAAREITLNVLVKESPEISVLHFDPGATNIGSGMQLRDETYSDDIRKWVQSLFDKGEFLSGESCAEALIKTLNDGNYESGHRVSAIDIKF